MNKREIRFLPAKKLEIRAKDGSDASMLFGYAAVFNSLSEDLGNFKEVIRPGAFTNTLAAGADVRALFNHDTNLVLGRTKSGTLVLSEDATGLYFEVELPDTTIAKDLAKSVARGDIDQCSFGFYCLADNWITGSAYGETAGGMTVREVTEAELFDVSVVTTPAYSSTSVEARSKVLFPDGAPERTNNNEVTVAEIKVGDSVFLKSGSPDMKVVHRGSDYAVVEWRDGTSTNSAKFPTACLSLEQRSDSQPSVALNGVGGDKDDCYEEQIYEIQDALCAKYSPGADDYYYCGKYWVIETYTDSVIAYEYATDTYFNISYNEVSNDVFEFGEPQPVEEAWVASERAAKFVAERRALAAKDAEQRAAKAAEPVAVASVVEKRDNEAGCACDCASCKANDCENCSVADCDDEDCSSSEAYMSRSLKTRLALATASIS